VKKKRRKSQMSAASTGGGKEKIRAPAEKGRANDYSKKAEGGMRNSRRKKRGNPRQSHHRDPLAYSCAKKGRERGGARFRSFLKIPPARRHHKKRGRTAPPYRKGIKALLVLPSRKGKEKKIPYRKHGVASKKRLWTHPRGRKGP